MFELAGQLEIRLDSGSGEVIISSSRPLTAARVFTGKTPAEVARQLPTLYSLCGTAQAAACLAACERALGFAPSAAVVSRRQALVDAETIKEHLWRLLLDWPRMLAPAAASKAEPMGRRPAAMPRVMRAFMAMRQAQQAAGDPFRLDWEQAERGAAVSIDASALVDLVTELALGMAPAEWLEAVDSPNALERWAAATSTQPAGLVCAVLAQGLASRGANAVARLPAAPWLPLATALASADADAFIAAPGWRQQCAETGPLARVAAHPLITRLLTERGNGLLTRLAAFIVELALIATRLTVKMCGAEAPLDDGDHQAAHLTSNADVDTTHGAKANTGIETVASASASASTSTSTGATATATATAETDACHGVHADLASANLAIENPAQIGIGSAEAARGLLVHRVSIIDGRVAHYQILAPTEWNFHPQGVVAQGLAAIARSGAEGPELERLARLYITAVDPCVDYQLSVS